MKKLLIIILILILPMVALAAALFSDGFESGDTSAWTAETDTEGDLTVTTGASLHGNYGMNLLIDNTTEMYVIDNTPADETRYRCRFYVDPNGLTFGDGEEFALLRTIIGIGGAAGNLAFIINLKYTIASGYLINVRDYTDGSYAKVTGNYPITDAPHCIEVDWTAATAPGENDGQIVLIIDGVTKETLTGIDSDTESITSTRFGATSGIDAGTSGTSYLDDFASNNDGSLIGQIGDNAIMFGCNF